MDLCSWHTFDEPICHGRKAEGSIWCERHTAYASDPNRPANYRDYLPSWLHGKDLSHANLDRVTHIIAQEKSSAINDPGAATPAKTPLLREPASEPRASATGWGVGRGSGDEDLMSHMYICYFANPDEGECTAAAVTEDHKWCERHSPENWKISKGSLTSTLGNVFVSDRCQSPTMAGRQCTMPARRDSTFCINHDPAYAAQQRENTKRGGVNSGAARRPIPLPELHIDLSSREGVQASAEAVIALELTGRISAARSRNILRALTIAYNNFTRYRSKFDEANIEPVRATLMRNLVCAAEEASLRDIESESDRLARRAAFRPPAPTPAPRAPSSSSSSLRKSSLQDVIRLQAQATRLGI